MSNILLARADDPALDSSTLEGIYRLRHHVFRERLGWEVESREGLEIDRFDAMKPVYALSRGAGRDVDGCWRLLPTTGPYMLKDVFPQLLRGEQPPEAANVWELSRFAVLTRAQGELAQGHIGPVVFGMMRRVFDFAVNSGIDRYVTVTSVAIERLFRHAGVPMRRFGDGQAQRIGKVLSVACWIDIDEATYRAVYQLPITAKEAA
jgi:acyl homoserine lactone synthase